MKLLCILLLMVATLAAAIERPKLLLTFEPPTSEREYAFDLTLSNASSQSATVEIFTNAYYGTNAFLGEIHVEQSDGTTLSLFQKAGRAILLSGLPAVQPKTAPAHGTFYTWKIPASQLCKLSGDTPIPLSSLKGRVAFAELRHVWLPGEHTATTIISDKMSVGVAPEQAGDGSQPVSSLSVPGSVAAGPHR